VDEAVLHIYVDKRCSLWNHRKINHKLCLDQSIQTVANSVRVAFALIASRGNGDGLM